MNFFNRNLKIAVIPVSIIIWGIFVLLFFDPFYSKSSDPEFPYLVNGLNCALLHFNRIGHIDHPGTPFQILNGIVIQITHLISGKGDIAQDVFSRPEYYLNAISISLVLFQVILIWFIGILGIKREIPFWQIAVLQSSFFYNEVLVWLMSRVNPDRFLMIVFLIFILIYLKHGYKNRSPLKFALWSGVVMALGFASKFNFIPLLILPLLFIDTNKNRLVYLGTGFVSFIIFIAPIIDRFKYYRSFITNIFLHEGKYGTGDSNVINFHKMVDNIAEIFKINPGLYILLSVLILMIILAGYNKGKKDYKNFIFPLIGILTILLLQIIIVSKHFANYYLVPIFSVYGFIFFYISLFLSKLLKKKIQVILLSSLLPVVFLQVTFIKVINDEKVISKMIVQREKIRNFVDKEIVKTDFWFVEPTWESGPFVENALVYGLSYCGHRNDYFPQLMAVNPNIITYEGNNNLVKLWRCTPVSLDSVLATGENIHIYSTPGRNATILIQMLQGSALKNSIQLQIDTTYFDAETENRIIRVKGINTISKWQSKNIFSIDRKAKIENYIVSIKNSPEWLEKIKVKAISKNIPLDSMILLDAIWMVDNESK
jgi:hypothetical protein